MRISLALVLAQAAPLGAHEDQPLFLPARDVMVTYRLTGGASAAPREAHMYFSAAGQKLRLEQSDQRGYAVLDRAAGTALVVVNARRQYATIPFDERMASGFILNDQMHFVRTGSDNVAGLPCTTWSVQSPRASGSVCVTEDGVMLRGSGQPSAGGATASGLEAVSVSYAAQPPSLFTPPPGFSPYSPPATPAQPGVKP